MYVWRQNGVRHDAHPKLAPASLDHTGTIVTQKGNEKDSLQIPESKGTEQFACQVGNQRKSPEIGLEGQINAARQIQVRHSRQKPLATRK